MKKTKRDVKFSEWFEKKDAERQGRPVACALERCIEEQMRLPPTLRDKGVLVHCECTRCEMTRPTF